MNYKELKYYSLSMFWTLKKKKKYFYIFTLYLCNLLKPLGGTLKEESKQRVFFCIYLNLTQW